MVPNACGPATRFSDAGGISGVQLVDMIFGAARLVEQKEYEKWLWSVGIPDTPFGECCNAHDLCYGGCGPRSEFGACNREMLACSRSRCFALARQLFNGSSVAMRAFTGGCLFVAEVYRAGQETQCTCRTGSGQGRVLDLEGGVVSGELDQASNSSWYFAVVTYAQDGQAATWRRVVVDRGILSVNASVVVPSLTRCSGHALRLPASVA